MFYRLVVEILRGIFSPICRSRIHHPERARESGAWILAANHISHFDPPLLSMATGRDIDWMAMEELFRNRIFGWLLLRVQTFPVHRGRPDRTALRTAVERLKASRVVGIFPEGGIRDGRASLLVEGEMRPGLALVAGLAGVPVRPVVIFGTDRLYASHRWRRWRGTPVWIGFGELLDPPGGSAEERQAFEERFVQALRELAQEMVEEYGLQEGDWPHSPQERAREGGQQQIPK